MHQMTPQLWIVLAIGMFFSIIALWYLLSDKYNRSFLNNLIIYASILFMCIALMAFNLISGIKETNENRVAATSKQNINEINQSLEIAAVTEFETNKKIKGDKAWWINLSSEELKGKCLAIALKMNRDWESLVDLLSGKNATLILSPQ